MSASIISGKIVEPYAEALMAIAKEHNLTEQFGDEIRGLLGLLENSPELREFLENPVVKGEDKKAVIRRMFGQETNAYLTNFLLLLVDRRRIIFISGIAQKFLELLRKLNNTALAVVTSAVPLNESQTNAIADKVKQITGAASVELKTKVDRDLIGGVIIQVGSKILDTSLRGQLRRISLSLT
jgi:F-type H+-transporting ATPase subunit delta